MFGCWGVVVIGFVCVIVFGCVSYKLFLGLLVLEGVFKCDFVLLCVVSFVVVVWLMVDCVCFGWIVWIV